MFKLRKGVRWHNKPPVNGRELTAEDVRYTYDRFLNIKGNSNKYMLEMVDKVEAPDKYTVKFTLREPNAWFIDRLASTSLDLAKSRDSTADLKSRRACRHGPDAPGYEPSVRAPSPATRDYFVPAPLRDGVDITMSTDPRRLRPVPDRRVRLRPEYAW